MIKLVSIDFDDTLSMTEYACFILENKVAVEMGYKPMARSTHKKNWGIELSIAIRERIPGIDVEKFLKKLAITHKKAFMNGEIDSIPTHNIESLDRIIEKQLHTAILTSRSISEAAHLMHQTNPLTSRIRKFYYMENSDFLKPDPRVFEKILYEFEVMPEESVYVGDSPGDAISAKGAGLHFVAVLESGIRTKKDFEGLRVDYFATSFTEAANYILSIA